MVGVRIDIAQDREALGHWRMHGAFGGQDFARQAQWFGGFRGQDEVEAPLGGVVGHGQLEVGQWRQR